MSREFRPAPPSDADVDIEPTGTTVAGHDVTKTDGTGLTTKAFGTITTFQVTTSDGTDDVVSVSLPYDNGKTLTVETDSEGNAVWKLDGSTLASRTGAYDWPRTLAKPDTGDGKQFSYKRASDNSVKRLAMNKFVQLRVHVHSDDA